MRKTPEFEDCFAELIRLPSVSSIDPAHDQSNRKIIDVLANRLGALGFACEIMSVSDNPEKSGIYNYYLMTAVEQGIPGLFIFLGLCFLVIIYGERAYHLTEVKQEKALLMAAVTSFILILAVLLINDLLEADKVGPIFFISAAIIAFFSEKTRKNEENGAKNTKVAKF